jgi:hypothetical protein
LVILSLSKDVIPAARESLPSQDGTGTQPVFLVIPAQAGMTYNLTALHDPELADYIVANLDMHGCFMRME